MAFKMKGKIGVGAEGGAERMLKKLGAHIQKFTFY